MRLKREQKSVLQEWVAAGLETGEINAKAAEFEPPFSVSRAQVDYYRKTRKVKLDELMASDDYDALKAGLALKVERVKRLTLLAALMEEDLFNGVLWTTDVKMIGTGAFQERVEFEEFNAAEVQQYRGILDDIAKEMGDRTQKIDQNNSGELTIRVEYADFDD
jgi:hypothetical protein